MCPLGGEVATSERGVVKRVPQHRRHSLDEKRRVVEETLQSGASVARVARAHGVNANQVYAWRRLYRQGLLENANGKTGGLLAVRVVEPSAMKEAMRPKREVVQRTPSGMIQVELPKGHLRIAGAWMQTRCVWCWRSCSDDCAGGGHAHLDRGGGDGFAPWIHRLERDGAGGAERKSLFGPSLHISWATRGFDQGTVVGWRRAVFIREEVGARKIHLGASHERNGCVDTGAALDVVGRD